MPPWSSRREEAAPSEPRRRRAPRRARATRWPLRHVVAGVVLAVGGQRRIAAEPPRPATACTAPARVPHRCVSSGELGPAPRLHPRFRDAQDPEATSSVAPASARTHEPHGRAQDERRTHRAQPTPIADGSSRNRRRRRRDFGHTAHADHDPHVLDEEAASNSTRGRSGRIGAAKQQKHQGRPWRCMATSRSGRGWPAQSHLVFNLLEEFGEDPPETSRSRAARVERYKYTGCGPGEFYLGRTRRWPRSCSPSRRSCIPGSRSFSRNGLRDRRQPAHALFVSRWRQDASIASTRSRWSNATELLERVNAIHDSTRTRRWPRSSRGARVLRRWARHMDAQALPRGGRRLGHAARRPARVRPNAKWGPGSEPSAESRRCRRPADDVPRGLQRSRSTLPRAAGGDSGASTSHGETGDIYVLEVNASCYLERRRVRDGAKAPASSIPPGQRIVESALERYGA